MQEIVAPGQGCGILGALGTAPRKLWAKSCFAGNLEPPAESKVRKSRAARKGQTGNQETTCVGNT